MRTIHVAVTAEHIAAAGPVPNDDGPLPPGHRDPVERAIAELTGQDVQCDEDEPGLEMATIGQGSTTLVVNLPPEESEWQARYFAGEAVEPFEFDIEIEDWLFQLLERAR